MSSTGTAWGWPSQPRPGEVSSLGRWRFASAISPCYCSVLQHPCLGPCSGHADPVAWAPDRHYPRKHANHARPEIANPPYTLRRNGSTRTRVKLPLRRGACRRACCDTRGNKGVLTHPVGTTVGSASRAVSSRTLAATRAVASPRTSPRALTTRRSVALLPGATGTSSF